MTIRIYPSRLPGEPLETHEHQSMSLDHWFSVNVTDYQHDLCQPVAVEVNGKPIPVSAWPLCFISPESDVRVYPVPYGTGAEFALWAAVALAVASAAYSLYMMSTLDTPGNTTGSSGDQLNLSPAKANNVKLGDPIREVFGKYRVYPDYIVQPTSRFDATNPEIYRTEMMVCVGVGRYSIPQSTMRIGSTPVSSFGDDVSYTLYGPGATVSSDTRSQNWWSSTEVGGTSSGSGLDTNSTAPGSIYVNADAILFTGNTITLIGVSNENSGENADDLSVPHSWVAGTVITVNAPDSYVVGKVGGYSVIYGNFTELGPIVGNPVTLTFNDTSYNLFIASYTPAVTPIPGVGGNAASITASAAPTTYDFSGTSYTFNITWKGKTYPISLIANYINMVGLLNTITGALTGSGCVAVEYEGRVVIQESASPFSGGSLTHSNLPAVVFGEAPVSVAGVASSGGSAGVEAHITLAYSSATGVAFGGLPLGVLRLALMYGVGQFIITGVDDTTITVNRLKITGGVDSNWPGFNSRTVLDASVSGENDAENWLGPFLACPEGEKTTVIENNFLFPNGHIQYKKNGDSQSHTVNIIVQYRNIASGGSWSQVAYRLTNQTVNGHGYTKRISGLASAQYEVRVRRTTKMGGSRTVNNVYWQVLRSRLSKSPARYANVTTLALTIRTGNRLASQSDRRVNLVATRIYDGYASRTMSGAIMHVLTSLGMSAEQIDVSTINALENNYWTPRGETFDFATNDDNASALDVLQKITNAGMSYFLLSEGLASVGREGVKNWTGIISPQETTEPLQVAFSAPSRDDFDGVDVTYVNGTTWTEETVQCRTPDNPTPTKVENYELSGVISEDRAYRIGMRRLMKYRQQRLTFSTSTEMDALCYNYGDRLVLTDDIPGSKTISCLITGVSVMSGKVIISVSEPLDWRFTHPRCLIRLQDGSATTLLTPSPIDDYTLSLPASSGISPDEWIMGDPSIEPPRLIFCSSERVGYDAIVAEISPASDGTCEVTAKEYRSTFYDYDDAHYPGDVA
ncbi:host specificity factor TipJ family phage tail protein [Yersinia intermedia]|uniref:host specificity factor TipJ family phage tail protein n=1 Tax=Yersinia intermedia TaxID=631 RepID=UPI0025AADBD3|nr:host specificity factor TipJ family phage tail protein [Yersinia intermedia]MDN0115035.1 host specificity factor TipJ family phage tail protein [Yersinia intermedia]